MDRAERRSLATAMDATKAATIAAVIVDRMLRTLRPITRSPETLAADVFERAVALFWHVAEGGAPAKEERVAIVSRLSPLVPSSRKTTKDPTTAFPAKGINIAVSGIDHPDPVKRSGAVCAVMDAMTTTMELVFPADALPAEAARQDELLRFVAETPEKLSPDSFRTFLQPALPPTSDAYRTAKLRPARVPPPMPPMPVRETTVVEAEVMFEPLHGRIIRAGGSVDESRRWTIQQEYPKTLATSTRRAGVWERATGRLIWAPAEAVDLAWVPDRAEIAMIAERLDSGATPYKKGALQTDYLLGFERWTWPTPRRICTCSLRLPTGWLERLSFASKNLVRIEWREQDRRGAIWVRIDDDSSEQVDLE